MHCKRLLVVDDDRSHSAVVVGILTRNGYEADAVDNGQSAVELAATKEFALAILDYQMPELNGVDTFQRIRELQPDLHGVLLTAYTTIDKVFPAIDSGIERVLSKPVDVHELLPVVQSIIGLPDGKAA